jgi:hypothetical protein
MKYYIELTLEEIIRLASLVENQIDEDEKYIQKFGDHPLYPEGNSVSRELNLYKGLLEKLMNP